jgi:hypothetical protein
VLQRFGGGAHAFGGATMRWEAPLPSVNDPANAALAGDAENLRNLLSTFLMKIHQRGTAWPSRHGSLPVKQRVEGTAPDVLVKRAFDEAVLDLAGAHGGGDDPRGAADVLKHALTRFLSA